MVGSCVRDMGAVGVWGRKEGKGGRGRIETSHSCGAWWRGMWGFVYSQGLQRGGKVLS